MLWRTLRYTHCGGIQAISGVRRAIRQLPQQQVIVYVKPRRYITLQSGQKSANTNGKVLNIASALKVTAQAPISITVQAIIRTIRNQKKYSFASLGDGSVTSELQVLLSPEQSKGLGTGTTVKIEGELRTCPPGKEQTHELHASKVEIVGSCDAKTYPIQKKYHTKEFLRTLPQLRVRTPWNGLLARLRSNVERLCSDWFWENEYIRVHPPIITCSDCEGAGEVFTVSAATPNQAPDETFFGKPTYLTVSTQLHLEACVYAQERVWTLGPTFRAERSDTPRHLSEFYMLEAEIQTESLEDVMDVVESLLRHIGSSLSSSSLGQEILSYSAKRQNTTNDHCPTSEISSRWQALSAPTRYPRITYTQAISHLEAAISQNPSLFTHPITWGSSLALEHEKYIASTIGSGNTPVFVTDYPTAIKPFYMLPSSSSSSEGIRNTVSSFDLLLPSLAELVGGSLRSHSHDQLVSAMQEKGLAQQEHQQQQQQKNLTWYTELRKIGSIPHGGFGLGFDRLLCYLAGEANIRDVVLWPRWHGRCDG